MARSVFVLGLALLVLPAILAQSTSRLRVEYLENPLTIDVKTPRFSWALQHTSRGQTQSAYQIIVNILQPTGGKGPTVWDTGKVASSTSLNVPYGGVPLADDSDYAWTVTWWDNNGAQAPAAAGQFSTGLYIPGSWLGAQWLTADNSSAATSSANVFRSEFNLPAVPVRARLYISGLGYHRTSINGVRVSLFELGQFTTFQKRTLYDVIDVKSALQQGCNTLGVMLGRCSKSHRHTNTQVHTPFLLIKKIIHAQKIFSIYGKRHTPHHSHSVHCVSLSKLISDGLLVYITWFFSPCPSCSPC